MTQRSLQALNTKKLIASCVMTLCTKKDFEKITINDICKAAGVSIGCFYHHFKCKEDVVAWSYTDFDMILENTIKSNTLFSSMSSISQILFIAENYYDFLISQEKSYTINAYRSQLTLGNKYVGDDTRYFYHVVHESARKWIDSNRLKLTWATDGLTAFLFRCIRGVAYDWCSKDGNYDLMQTGLTELNIILSGLEKQS